MNYKNIFKSQKIRFKILNALQWVPDKLMIKLQYKIKTGRKLNLKKPERFTEKLQWYKLYYKNPLMHQCVDKYEVRKYVINKGLNNILNELYGVYDDIKKINFKDLPNKFVIKSTNGGGGINVIICEDKKKLDITKTKKIMKEWMSFKPKKSLGREWAYETNQNKIIIEKYIESPKNKNFGIDDYKFFCFNGKVEYIYGITERNLGKSAKLGIYDSNFKLINAYRKDEEKIEKEMKKPKNFEQMKKYAEILSKDFPHARIDLYNIDGEILFGEITFYDGSGYMAFEPDSFDYELGEKFELRTHEEYKNKEG